MGVSSGDLGPLNRNGGQTYRHTPEIEMTNEAGLPRLIGESRCRLTQQ
jgi:hypothetical protein